MQLKRKIILASQSPRRQQLLKELGFTFTVKTKDVKEDFPPNLVKQEIPLFLAALKAEAFKEESNAETIIIAADTIVWIKDRVLNKPADAKEAKEMLQLLSGNMHQVFTGVCLLTHKVKKSFFSETKVYFKNLSEEEIDYYIKNYSPYDKAGAYGAQEWMGFIAIEKIEGSYFNVMGLPVKELYEELMRLENNQD